VTTETPERNSRAKYWTLAVLVVWLVAVFVFTLFKYSAGVVR
jgi:hypothetical protein